MAKSNSYDVIYKYIVRAELTDPMHIGSSADTIEDILTHPVDGIPFIQASSIAGAFREQYQSLFGKEETDFVFGKSELSENSNASDYGSKVFFSDGQFEKTVIEYRPHVTINRESGAAENGSKFNMEYLAPGSLFSFDLYLFADSALEVDNQGIEEIFKSIQAGDLQFGGQKTKGCGYFKIRELRRKKFDMKTAEDRGLWMHEDDAEIQYDDLTKNVQSSETRRAYRIKVFGKTEETILVKAVAAAMDTEKSPDSGNIKNGKKEFILPASSIKGTIRSHAERIAAFLESNNRIASGEELISQVFGRASKGEDKGVVGNARFFDAVLEDAKTHTAHRIHVDKFTGGVIDGALFTEEEVCADKVVLSIDVEDKHEPDRTCGLLLLVLRDIALKSVNFGSGYNIGRGLIDVDTIELTNNNGQKAVIDVKTKKIEDEQRIVKGVLAALN